MEKERKKPGRKPLGDVKMAPLQVRLPPDMHEAIDAVIASRMDRPDRAALLRRYIAEGLERDRARLK